MVVNVADISFRLVEFGLLDEPRQTVILPADIFGIYQQSKPFVERQI